MLLDIIKARYILDSSSPSGLRNRHTYHFRRQCKANRVAGKLLASGVYQVSINSINYDTNDIISLLNKACTY